VQTPPVVKDLQVLAAARSRLLASLEVVALDIYSHVMPHMQRQAADPMDAALTEAPDILLR